MFTPIRSAILALATLTPLPALADSPRTILVLDGSGSMWGQIEGEAKITIARTVVGDLLGEIPSDMELGLTVYGHRRKGDCGDIESLVPVGANTTDAIRAAVNGIKPKGKTPLSAAVLAAAEELKYTEEKATVILVSDGRETCDVDPCALGQRLEETGVDFTAHVVGFDVSDDQDRAQLQCLAENTGGTFVSASNATELKDALTKVAAPTEFDVTFRATDGENGPTIDDGLIWTVTQQEETLLDHDPTASPTLTLKAGDYLAEVLRPSDEATAEATFTLTPDGPQEVVLTLETPLPTATITAPETAEMGSTIKVEWTGPDEQSDYIAIYPVGDEDARYTSYTFAQDGSPLKLLMPPEPGDYEIRYVLNRGKIALASTPISITEAEVTVTAPETAEMGSTIKVEWEGPNAKNDYIAIFPTDDDEARFTSYTFTQDGSPLKLLMPAEPGEYEIRYILNQGKIALASTPISIKEAEVSITAPETAEFGSTIKVEWGGPDAQGDYIAIYPAGDDDARYTSYTFTQSGNPLKLLMPAEPGDYEIRYVLNQGKTILATTPISITEAEVTISAPETAEMGSTVKVEWNGPDAAGDIIAIYPAGDEDARYTSYTHTSSGSPLKLLMPPSAGDYEIRYILNQGKTALATTPISITEAEVTISAPGTAELGSTAQVEWTGPDAAGDIIAIYPAGDEDARYTSYKHTSSGSPLKLLMPPSAGDYEIRYILNQGKTVLATTPISITAVEASLAAPDAATPGALIEIEWIGPAASGDLITVASPDTKGGKYIGYVRVADETTVKLRMPDDEGDYELRYVLNQGKTILAQHPIKVAAP